MADSAQIAKVNHHHEAIADAMLAYPDKSKGDLAAMFGYTQSHLSIIINSDAFIAYYEQRRMAYNQHFHQRVVTKLYDVGMKAIDKVSEALDDVDVDPRFALDAKDSILDKLGFGVKSNPTSAPLAVQQNFYVSKDTLQEARQRMSEVHGQKAILPSGERTEGVDIEDATILSESTPKDGS